MSEYDNIAILRDRFAIAAIAALRPIDISVELGEEAKSIMAWNSKWAYAYADAMLVERNSK